MKVGLKNTSSALGNTLDLYTGGLKIYTTINAEMQRNAETSVREHMSNYQRIFDLVKEDRKYGPFFFEEDLKAM